MSSSQRMSAVSRAKLMLALASFLLRWQPAGERVNQLRRIEENENRRLN